MPKQSREFEHRFDGAYRIDEGWLRAFFGTLTELGLPDASATVDLSEKQRISDLTLQELLALRNSKSDSIEYLAIRSSRYGEDALYVSAYFHQNDFSVSISGSEREAVFADSKLRGLFEEARVGYGWLTSSRFWFRVASVNLFINLANVVFLTVVWLAIYRGDLTRQQAAPFFVTNTAIWVAALLISVCQFATRRLFPRKEILIGDGISRSKQLLERRRQLFWVLIVGVAVVVVSAAITKLLGLT